MVKVTFVSADGSSVDVEGEVGRSVMECAVENMIPEIEAQCGGAGACATCHCYPREEWMDKLSPKGDFEEMTLQGGLAEVKQNSRLACQVLLTEENSGMIIDLPEPAF
ncbi:2Fe-2S iron-sulfur cluster-binding protein [Maricurvus nonylphenolicus]|uniref:2Fe-2S iron-sulfur cluster-binding protein n=1 Tax=Maricurvus nonylphenolicus TaxID=1008307 RepID=UPI0036F33AA9